MIISNDLPAGNIQVLEQKENRFVLDVEMRDSTGDWFYWKFKAVFPKAAVYRFHFKTSFKIGTRGPAISFDRGKTWQWQRNTPDADSQDFLFECKEPGEVWFCQALPYQQEEFDAFAKEFQTKPFFHLETLCKSRKGRGVELVRIREGNPKLTVLLTSRHHAQEMMATHALEGVLRAVAADSGFGKKFRKKIALYAVPFVDKDGVEEGDQGKNRNPHDHGRDYAGENSIYPECGAIRKLIDIKKPFFILDMHCPWIRGGSSNETIYMVDGPDILYSLEMKRFGRLLEQETAQGVPYRQKNDIPFGTTWNTSQNYRRGQGLKYYGNKKDFVKFAQTIEIPFANAGTHPIDRKDMLSFGESIARAILRYAEELEQTQKTTSAKLCFTGDIMCNPAQTKACSTPEGIDYSPIFSQVVPILKDADFRIGNLETPFAGEKADYSSIPYSFNTPDSFANALAEAGFNLLSTANNHCLDRRVEGLKRTLDVLDRAGLAHTGTARSSEERERIFLTEIKGLRVAFLSYTYGTNAFANHIFLKEEEAYAVNLTQPQETLPGSVHLLNPPEKIAKDMESEAVKKMEFSMLIPLKNDIAAAKRIPADYVIVLLHSGGQYNGIPDPYTEFLVRKIRDFGADMIVGNHPHVVQKYSEESGIPVFYSLGNFSFTPGASPENKKHPISEKSILIQPVLRKEDGKTKPVRTTFQVLCSKIQPGGKSVVVPLYEFIRKTTDSEEKERETADFKRIVRTVLQLPETADVELRKEYVISPKTNPAKQD